MECVALFLTFTVSRLSAMNHNSCAMSPMSMGAIPGGVNPALGMFDQHKAGLQFPLVQRRKRRVLFSQAQVYLYIHSFRCFKVSISIAVLSANEITLRLIGGRCD